MKTVKVNKDKLLKTLKKNRKKHRGTFEKAQDKYREEFIRVLDRRLKEAREGGKINTRINLPEPQDFTESYDTAIEMVEWAEDDTIELTQQDFEQYILDRWGWQNVFAANTASYLAQ
jgi:hypothetical protein